MTAGVFAAGLSVATLAGCGGDDGAGDALTRAGFVEKGNAICAASEDRIIEASKTAFPEKGTAPTIPEIESFATDTVVPEVQGQIKELRKLKPPPDDRSRITEMLSQAEKGVDTAKNDPTVIGSRDGNPFARFDELAADYGLTTCGEGSSKTRALMSGVTRS